MIGELFTFDYQSISNILVTKIASTVDDQGILYSKCSSVINKEISETFNFEYTGERTSSMCLC